MNSVNQIIIKNPEFVIDKVEEHGMYNLGYLFNEYFNTNVIGSSSNTCRAKKRDIEDFLKFYFKNLRNFNQDYWTPSASRFYQNYLLNNLNLKPTTINRKIATLRHAASWIHKKYPFVAGHPFEGIKDIDFMAVAWKGLTNTEIMRLKAACDIRMASCKRKNQNPLLETVILYVLLHTGLREMELCRLNYGQYNGKGFVNVRRKGNKVSEFVAVSLEARKWLDLYLVSRVDPKPDAPMFLNIKNSRLTPQDVYYACTQIKLQANARLPEHEHIKFSPHSLRHAFLKRVADKHDIHVAQELSGNVSMKEIYRYTRPSVDEATQIVEELF